ncbi:MAG: nitrogen regulation protein NR(I) [Chromatiales bacterium]|jgi:two-component system, NtrC family, nitrogen regulation response regulator GlnG|nr:nitrogen regulation protein NR(I) [Chromatiales bacterium]
MNASRTVWIVDDDRSIRWVLEKALGRAGITVRSFGSADGVLEGLQHQVPQALISDIRMPGMDGLDLLRQVCERHPHLPVIVMTAYSDLDSAVSAYQGGAFEYLPKPFDVDEAVALVERAINHARMGGDTGGNGADGPNEILGSAAAMQEVFRAIGRLSRSNITVLITGESGTGKELVARALHQHSPRIGGQFIAINTAAIPRDLLESELFGHERGAFTGAQMQRQGRFEQADGGTLFLDEIGDMPADLQTRLLRVLSDGEFYRVGGHTPVRANVRIIAATHQDLETHVAEGMFREDLFHRLNVIRVHVPALRERREDIGILARTFLQAAARELEVDAKVLTDEAEQHLTGLPWPGNVRQLENTCRWLTVMASGTEVRVSDLPSDLRADAMAAVSEGWEIALGRWTAAQLTAGETDILGEALPRFEQIMIDTALKYSGGRRQDAAKLLGWGRNTLTRKIKEHSMYEYSPQSDDLDSDFT